MHSSRKRENPDAIVSTDEGTPTKRIKLEKAESDSSGIEKNDSLADLPTEILHAILQNVSTSDLIKCRPLNRKFNEIASRTIRRRADISLHFSRSFYECFMQKIPHRHCEELLVNICSTYSRSTSKSLTELVECLKESEHFPITHFQLDDLHNFNSNDMMSFLEIWGGNILGLNTTVGNDGQTNCVGMLRDQLVEKVPNLNTLSIHFDWMGSTSSIDLFANSLPKLQSLTVNKGYRGFRAIVANILNAACNLNEFNYVAEDKNQGQYTCVQESFTAEDLALLDSCNKLHCLKNLRIDLSEEIIAYCGKSPKIGDVKLESLALSLQLSIRTCEELKSSATAIVNQLFRSSANVMQMLAMESLGSLPGIVVPKMEKLHRLDLWGCRRSTKNAAFPPLFEMAENFPNLKELGLYFEGEAGHFFETSQPMKPMPRVEILRINGDVSMETRELLMQATPNVVTLLIEENEMIDDNRQSVATCFQAISKHLPKLQSFGWLIYASTHHDLLHLLDAATTGLPIEFCRKESEKLRNADSLPADELDFYQSQERNPSILDLKELRRFDVNFLMDEDAYAAMDYKNSEKLGKTCRCEGSLCDSQCEAFVEREDEKTGFGPADLLYRTGFSKVSKFLAFDLMPNLTVRTHLYLD